MNSSVTSSDTEMDFSSYRALIIDDVPFIRPIVVSLLNHMGFAQVEEAEDGESAMRVNQTCLPNLIVCDVKMEPVGGLDFLRSIRDKDHVNNSDAAFVFLSQHTDAETIEKALKLGVDAFVVKPLFFALLKERVEFAMNRYCSA
jgi:CheY-like chemotaxis protein